MIRWILLGLVAGGCCAGPALASDYRVRLRANDAPIGGRFTIEAFMLDTLDTVLELPESGRVAVVRFSGATGRNSFIVPGDLTLRVGREQEWKRGFQPLGPERLAGAFPSDTTRWALWWVGSDSTFTWEDAEKIRLTYGEDRASFHPLGADRAHEVAETLPWETIRACVIDPDRSVTEPEELPNPAVFDKHPQPRIRTTPEYPTTARMYAYEGIVHVAAVIDTHGAVTDAYVVNSSAQHLLNVSALISVMNWTFTVGWKGTERATGTLVVPITFTMGSRDQ